VADDHDVLNLQVVHRELNNRQGVQIGMHDHVGDVAVHEHLARVKGNDFIRRYPAVGAADPQVLGRLLARELLEEARALQLHACGPGSVVVKQMLE